MKISDAFKDVSINTVNSQLSEELLHNLDYKSMNELRDLIDNVQFIKNLTSSNRKRAKDLPRDSRGRVIVELENFHILEDMDFFRQPALYYKKHGVYTHLFPNPNPTGEYRKFWDEEIRRCREGYVRESDGEWVTGYHYFYLNYSPIEKVIIDEFGKPDRGNDFGEFWDGDYLFFHYIEKAENYKYFYPNDQFKVVGKQCAILKTRGRGYSFKGGSMADRNYTMYSRSKSFLFASEKEYLLRDGIMSKATNNMNFVDSNTPWGRSRGYKDTDDFKRASYKDKDSQTEQGFMSEIMAVTCKNDPDKGRGKRGKLLFFDESGKFSGLLDTWKVARKSVEQGKLVYGLMLTAGTGGTIGSDFEAAEKFFYEPDGYGILALNNVFSKKAINSKCSLFIPEYLNREGHYDSNGNSNVISALVEVLEVRQNIRNNASDPNALVGEKAEAPLVPEEAVMKVEGNLFPVADLKEYLAEIKPNIQNFVAQHTVGEFTINSSGVIFKTNDNLNPIREYPLRDRANMIGAPEIFELPSRNGVGSIMNFRYIAGIDPVDDDSSTTNSLPSIFVMDRLTNRIVAEYTGRPQFADDFYEVCIRLLLFYNGTANYENDKKGLYNYFKQKSMLQLLCKTPSWLKDKQIIKGDNLYGNKVYGTNSGKEVNAAGRRLLRDWMMRTAYGEDAGGLMNLQKIRSIALIEEAISWTPDLNCDRISAMGMLMIYKEELYTLDAEGVKETRNKVLEDDFFKRCNIGYTKK